MVGGGIVGAATAYFLARARLQHVLLEGRIWAGAPRGAIPAIQWLHTRKAGLQMELALAGRASPTGSPMSWTASSSGAAAA